MLGLLIVVDFASRLMAPKPLASVRRDRGRC
jgi:hypothetical protein